MFNFNSLSNTNFASTSGQYLKPYDIYEVYLTKIEKSEIKGKKDPNQVYPVVSLEFTEAGDTKRTYSENIFIPASESDMERPTFKNKEGHDYQAPSHFENFQYTLMQIVHALNPVGEEKIKENASKIKSIDQFIDLVIKALAGKDKIKTNLKLVGRNSDGAIYATLPKACGLTKAGEIFPTNFIGDNLFFNNYELTQQKNYKNAKPTSMPKNDDVSDTGSDVDLADLDLG